MHLPRHLAGLLAATTLLAACTTGEAAVEDEASSEPTPSVAPEPSPEPAEPTVAYAALASEPGAVAVAEVLAGMDGQDPVVVEGVLAADQRASLRTVDEIVVVALPGRPGTRLAASADRTTPTDVHEVADAEAGLAAVVEESVLGQLDRYGGGSLFPGTLHVTTSEDPAELAALATDLPHGDALLQVPGDLRSAGPGNTALTAALLEDVPVEVGTDVPTWQVDVLHNGLLAPGGGQLLTDKRFIAMYGTPGTGALGVLGEQDVSATVERIARIAEPYDDGSLPIVPTFEIIVDVAHSGATEDGDYSYSINDDFIREWVDRAAQEGFLVILDIQPGRTDFLTHAKQLEEFLVQPHVGLALDPEWRLKPNQVHLRQIGTVTGTEVNTVVDWLAELVREHALPQKMLVLHQFRYSMITEFETIKVPDELFVTLHMDGQGGLGAKYATFDALFGRGIPQSMGMHVGWKQFYDEDFPMATPEQVLALDPQPVVITFQ